MVGVFERKYPDEVAALHCFYRKKDRKNFYKIYFILHGHSVDKFG